MSFKNVQILVRHFSYKVNYQFDNPAEVSLSFWFHGEPNVPLKLGMLHLVQR
jgi:hypothetical protein